MRYYGIGILLVSFFLLVDTFYSKSVSDQLVDSAKAKHGEIPPCSQKLTFKKINPPGIIPENPRYVLMGVEIPFDKLDKLDFRPGSGGFLVFFENRELGSCSIN